MFNSMVSWRYLLMISSLHISCRYQTLLNFLTYKIIINFNMLVLSWNTRLDVIWSVAWLSHHNFCQCGDFKSQHNKKLIYPNQFTHGLCHSSIFWFHTWTWHHILLLTLSRNLSTKTQYLEVNLLSSLDSALMTEKHSILVWP